MKSGEARAKDGTKLVYKLWPSSAAKGRMVLLHSLAMDHSFWIPMIDKLGGAAEVLAMDCRGHGASGKPPGPYTVELFADDLAAVMDDAGWDKALIAGCSMGGCVALAFAAAYRERATALGLIDTTAYYGDNAPKAWEERAQKALQEGMAALVGFQKSRWFGDAFREANPDVVDAALDIFLANDIPAYAETCRMLGACDLRTAMPKFDFPTRIIVGEEDYAAPVAMAEAMRDAIPGSTMLVIEKARHLTPLEVPDLIAKEMLELLGKTSA